MRPARSTKLLLPALLLALATLARAQDEYPHMTLQDGVNPPVPAPGSIFDSSHVFPAFSGASFQVRVDYVSPVQPSNNVFWGVLVSLAQTPFPTSLEPPDFTPPLFTMPPFVLVLPPSPTLSAAGTGQMTLLVPPGILAFDAYLQALVYDAPHVPAKRLSNGVKLEVEVPDYSVRLTFIRNFETFGEGAMDASGFVDIDGDTLKTLKPVGSAAPPQYVPVEPPPAGVVVESGNDFQQPYRFLEIVPNVADEPVNPLARPVTTIVGSVDAMTSTIPVVDTSFFPPRGRLLIAFGSGSLFANKVNDDAPDAEVVVYDGITPTSFLNCQRAQLGSNSGIGNNFNHQDGQLVLGEYTLATTAGARTRTRVGLDADNRDMPHVVIPKVTYDGGEGVGPVTHDVDVYRYELINSGVQGFAVMDRTSGRFRRILSSEMTPSQGPWYPMVCIAPDGRSMAAAQRVSGGIFNWDNLPDRLFMIRLDGLSWPAAGSETWQIGYQTVTGPTNENQKNIRSRRFVMRSTAIIGPDPENYVLFAGLADKWVKGAPIPGSGAAPGVGYEAEYVREEVLVHDLIDCPLVPPGSSKGMPAMPRLYLGPQFGSTGTALPILRYDPDVLVSPNRREVFLIAGNSDTVEDAFVVRNVGISAAGTVNKSVVNVSGFATSKRLRPPTPGGHGQGRRAAFSPDGKRVVFLSADGITFQSRLDFLNIASTNGLDYGQVKQVYADASGKFKHPGALGVERAVMGLRWLDDDRIAFLMGRSPYDDPLGTIGGFTPGVDLFVYDRKTDVMTNVTGTDGSASGFDAYGTINPAGYFGSPSGQFSYLLDFGVAGAGSALPAGTPVRDVIGIEHASASDFRLAGALGSLVPHLALPQSECLRPVEAPAAMRFVEGHGVQQGMLYFTAHVKDGNAGDELMALNRDAPFVALQATFSAKPDTLLSNVSPSASSGKVAFARTDTPAKNAANQHPFVVDLDHFLFERDVLPTWTTPGGGFLGRVMDGSLHIVPPQGGAGEGLVLGFGLTALPSLGTAQIAVPAYYPLATVSNPLAEPIPVVIPLIDTLLLGADFRFYVPFAAPSQSD